MKRSALVLVSMLLAVTGTASQNASPQPLVCVSIRPADRTRPGGGGVGVQQAEMYIGGSWAELPAEASAIGAQIKTRFRLRAWKEGDKSRAVVYAVLKDTRAPQGETETPIRTVALSFGHFVTVTETRLWAAEPIVLAAESCPRTR